MKRPRISERNLNSQLLLLGNAVILASSFSSWSLFLTVAHISTMALSITWDDIHSCYPLIFHPMRWVGVWDRICSWPTNPIVVPGPKNTSNCSTVWCDLVFCWQLHCKYGRWEREDGECVNENWHPLSGWQKVEDEGGREVAPWIFYSAFHTFPYLLGIMWTTWREWSCGKGDNEHLWNQPSRLSFGLASTGLRMVEILGILYLKRYTVETAYKVTRYKVKSLIK